jgi:hypothetical protein
MELYGAPTARKVVTVIFASLLSHGRGRVIVTTQAFLELWGLASLRDLPDLARLVGKAPLPEELRGALGIRRDDEDEDRAEIDADEDREGGEEYVGVGLFEE